jgi:hypothetical protein
VGGVQSGLWVHDLDKKQTRKVLDGPIFPISLAPDRAKLIFNLPSPYFEIWAADLDPNARIVDSLGPGLTIDEFYQERLAFYTQRIEADPENPDNYYLRAQCHDYLGDRASANADMRRRSAVAGGGQPSDLLFGTRPDFRRVLSLPFDSELVFGEPTNLGPPVNTSYGETAPFISADGLSLYFASNRGGGYGGYDLWMTTRETTSDPWGEPVNLGPTVNTSSGEGTPRISADGLSLYFESSRGGGYGGWDLWMTTRETRSDPWGEPVNLGPTVNSPADEAASSISADGLELYFGEWNVVRPGGYGHSDLWITNRPTKDDPWGTPVNLGDTVNSSYFEGGPFISADSLTLFFIRNAGPGTSDIWMTRRATDSDPWCAPVNLGPTINSPFDEGRVCLSADGSTLYFTSRRSGGSGNWDLWQAPVLHWPDDIEAPGGADQAEILPKGSEGKEVVPDTNH